VGPLAMIFKIITKRISANARSAPPWSRVARWIRDVS